MNSTEFEKIFLPFDLDYNPETKSVTFVKPAYGTKEFYYNHECLLEIDTNNEWVSIDYYSMDDVMLSNLLFLENDYLAFGSLKRESLGQIQSRALQVLSGYIENAEVEIMQLFDVALPGSKKVRTQ